jgi:hypothetical protein
MVVSGGPGFRLVKVHQGFAEPVGPEVAAGALDEALGEVGEDGPAPAVIAEVGRGGEAVGLVQPAVPEGVFRSFQPDE